MQDFGFTISPNPRYVDKEIYVTEVTNFLKNYHYCRALRIIRNEFNPAEDTVEYLFAYLLIDVLKNNQFQANFRAELSYKAFRLLVIESLWRALIYPKFRLDDPFFKEKLQLNKRTRDKISTHVNLQAGVCLALWKILERLASLGRIHYTATILFQMLWHEPSGLMFPDCTTCDLKHSEITRFYNESQNYLRNFKGLSIYRKRCWDDETLSPPVNPFQEWPVSNLVLEAARKEAQTSPVFCKAFYVPFVESRCKLIKHLKGTTKIICQVSPKGVFIKASR